MDLSVLTAYRGWVIKYLFIEGVKNMIVFSDDRNLRLKYFEFHLSNFKQVVE
jgi:hypothetical protein